MADNGDNAYGVTFGRIMFLQKIISQHQNVSSFERHSDLAFDVARRQPNDRIQIVCVYEYTLAEAMALRIAEDFPEVNLIFVGGKWNHSTGEASSFCRSHKIGICNAGNINAALSKTRYWL